MTHCKCSGNLVMYSIQIKSGGIEIIKLWRGTYLNFVTTFLFLKKAWSGTDWGWWLCVTSSVLRLVIAYNMAQTNFVKPEIIQWVTYNSISSLVWFSVMFSSGIHRGSRSSLWHCWKDGVAQSEGHLETLHRRGNALEVIPRFLFGDVLSRSRGIFTIMTSSTVGPPSVHLYHLDFEPPEWWVK